MAKVREIALEARSIRESEREARRAAKEAERAAREADRPRAERERDREVLAWIESESLLAAWFPGKQWDLVDRALPLRTFGSAERAAVVRPKGETDVLVAVIDETVHVLDPYRLRPQTGPTNWMIASIRVSTPAEFGDALASFDDQYASLRGDGPEVGVSGSGRPRRRR